MRTLVNYHPMQEFRQMEEMFDRFFTQGGRSNQGTASLPVDVTEREGKIVVRAAVPGVDPKDLDVQVENGVLTIQGEHHSESTQEGEKVYRREVSYGSFARSVRLPQDVNLDGVTADFRHGMVTITIPRVVPEKPQPRRIEVRTQDAPASLPVGNESDGQTNEAESDPGQANPA